MICFLIHLSPSISAPFLGATSVAHCLPLPSASAYRRGATLPLPMRHLLQRFTSRECGGSKCVVVDGLKEKQKWTWDQIYFAVIWSSNRTRHYASWKIKYLTNFKHQFLIFHNFATNLKRCKHLVVHRIISNSSLFLDPQMICQLSLQIHK